MIRLGKKLEKDPEIFNQKIAILLGKIGDKIAKNPFKNRIDQLN